MKTPSNTSKDSLRKRRCSSIESTESYAIKKSRSTAADALDINTLRYDEHFILAQAADILHVPVPNLRSRINELEDLSLTCIGFYDYSPQPPRPRTRRPSSRMKPTPRLSSLYLPSSPEKSAIGTDSAIDEQNVDQNASQQWTAPNSANAGYLGFPSSSLQISTAERDNMFGFQKGAFFADCLATFCLDESHSSLDNGYGKSLAICNLHGRN